MSKPVVIKTLESSDNSKIIYPRTSVNAFYKDDGVKANIVILDENGKIPVEQIPEMDGSGIALGKAINISTDEKSQRIGIRWTDPEDIVLDGITLSSFGGTKVVRKIGSYPENHTDGTLVVDSKVRNQYSTNYFYDTRLTNNTTYYYKLFTYNTDKKYNNLQDNQFTAVPSKTAVSGIPAQSGTLTYNGSAQTPSWTNYDPSQLDLSVSAQTNAGTYSAIFIPKSDYCWPDGSDTAKDISWTIQKATGVITISSTSLAVDGSNLTRSATVSVNTESAISYSPASLTGLTMSLTGTTFSITSDGSTAITATDVVFSANGDDNHTKPEDKTITVSATYWEFGAGNGEGADADWWLGLQSYLQNGGTGANLRTTSGASIVGATKTVTLTSAVLGTTSHLIRVIGVDQDAPNTVTWQTANCLANTTVFSSNSAVWIGSTARTECQNYYDAFPAKSAIMTVSKGTCPNTDDNRAGTATYNNETVWLPSEREMGLDTCSPISIANSTTSNAECTEGRNFSYSYYTSDNSRIKKLGDSGEVWHHWERSRLYRGVGGVCRVHFDGSASNGHYSSVSGLAPAYVIG